jgi:Protein of unknown function (DUF4199)
MVKLALRYGLIIAAGVMAWSIIAHMLVPDPTSKVHSLGAPIFFNVLQFVGIYLGISALGRELGERPTFKQGLKTGVWISLVYAVTVSLFFLVVILVIGPRWLQGEPGVQQLAMSTVALQAFLGLFIGSLLFGLIYSTVISFALAKRQTRQA